MNVRQERDILFKLKNLPDEQLNKICEQITYRTGEQFCYRDGVDLEHDVKAFSVLYAMEDEGHPDIYSLVLKMLPEGGEAQ